MTRLASLIIAAAIATVAATAPLANAAEVAGVKVDETARTATTDLVLNGAGLRKKLFFKVYVAALYVPRKTGNTGEILDSREPRRVTLQLLRDLDADSFVGALKEGLRLNHSDSELAVLKQDIDQFELIMRKVGNAKEGDRVVLDFTADGTAVGFNGLARGNIAGAAFGRALLKVWIGDKPVAPELKRALLGG